MPTVNHFCLRNPPWGLSEIKKNGTHFVMNQINKHTVIIAVVAASLPPLPISGYSAASSSANVLICTNITVHYVGCIW